jgi:hypothetical protein
MPIPKLQFEDPTAGLPPQPVPVRLACIVANWSPALFAEVVLGKMNEHRPFITVHEFDPKADWTGEVQSENYEQYRQHRGRPLCEQLAELPANHFVWSDDLVSAFSDLIDLTIGRESAAGLGIRWQPALGDCADVVAKSIDLSSVTQAEDSPSSIRVGAKACVVNYDRTPGHFKEGKGLKYILVLLRHPEVEFGVMDLEGIVYPPHPDALASTEHAFADAKTNADDTTPGDHLDTYPTMDKTAVEQIKAKIEQLKDQITEARELGDEEKQEKLEQEIDELLETFRASMDKDGKPRELGGTIEQKRKSISLAIDRAIKDIKGAHLAFGVHLANSIRTGSVCSYTPIPPTRWHITVTSPSQA